MKPLFLSKVRTLNWARLVSSKTVKLSLKALTESSAFWMQSVKKQISFRFAKMLIISIEMNKKHSFAFCKNTNDCSMALSVDGPMRSFTQNNDVARAGLGEAVGDVRSRIARETPTLVDIVVIADAKGRYAGAVPIGDLLGAPAACTMDELVHRAWPSASVDLDQEHAAEMAAAAGVTTLPVVDVSGRAVGCIPALALLRIMTQEHREDVHRMAGILRNSSASRRALEDPPLRRFKRRLPWLLVGLGLSTLGTAVMAGFEATLQRQIAVAFFIPALVYLTDAIGTQTEAIAVRGLPFTQQSFGRLLSQEVATGALIGAVLGLIAFGGIWVAFGDVRLASAVSLSLLVAGAIASAIGLSLPWALSRFGIDPALGSGPVATIVQDVLTLVVYFATVTAVLA